MCAFKQRKDLDPVFEVFFSLTIAIRTWLKSSHDDLFLITLNIANLFSFVSIPSSTVKAPTSTWHMGHHRAQMPNCWKYSSSSSIWPLGGLHRQWSWQLWSRLWVCHVVRPLAELTYSTQRHFFFDLPLIPRYLHIVMCLRKSSCINLLQALCVCAFLKRWCHTNTESWSVLLVMLHTISSLIAYITHPMLNTNSYAVPWEITEDIIAAL